MTLIDWAEAILFTLAVVLAIYSLNGGFYDHGGLND
jgi:hypothetical protein